MWKVFVRRVLMLVPQLFALSVLIFIIGYMMPGDAFTGMISPQYSPQRVAQLREIHGLDDPWYVQYARWMRGAARGDFGRSLTYRLPVTELAAQRALNTVHLQLLTLALMYAIALPLGIIAGKHNGRLPEKIISTYGYLMLATPTVVFGMLVLYVFGFRLGWVPVRGSVDLGVTSGVDYFVSRLRHMIAPALTGALLWTTHIVQYLRNEIVEFKNSDFVTTARSKGVPMNSIYTRHILRNALLPIAASLGLMIFAMLTGSVFIESVFSYPGLGGLFLDSIMQRDYSVINFLLMLFGVMLVLGAFVSDVLISVADPRIRIR